MINLDQHLNGIARKHGIDVDTKPKPTTPKPTYKLVCSQCDNGPALVDNLCEPCYRTRVAMPLLQVRDKLYKQLSDLDMQLVRAEAKLKNAKILYNRAEKQNWQCTKCKKVFTYFGDLFAHEQEKTCEQVRQTPSMRRAAKRDEEIY